MIGSLRTVLVGLGFMLNLSTHAQSNSDSILFIRVNPVYNSALTDFSSSDLLMLKFKTIPTNFKYDSFFCALSTGKFKGYSDIMDSLGKTFFIYKVEFGQRAAGQRTDSLLTNTNHYPTGYLIPLLEHYGGAVANYIIQRFTWKFDSVKYNTTKIDCNENGQGCVVKVESIR